MNPEPSPAQVRESINRHLLRRAIEKLEAEGIAEHREEMALQRCEMCGTWYRGTSPRTGGPLTYQITCDDYRRCEVCRERKADEMTDGLMKIDGPLFVGELRMENWPSVRRRWNRWGVGYRRFEITEGIISNLHRCYLVIFDDVRARQDTHISTSTERLPDYDLSLHSVISKALERSPQDKRISGNLGRTEPEPPPEDAELITIEVILTDAEPEVRRQAWEVAVQKTSYLSPTTPWESEQACKERTNAYKEALEFLGASVTDSKWIKRYVSLRRISWNYIGTKRTSKQPELIPLGRESLGWYKSGVPIGTIPSGALPGALP